MEAPLEVDADSAAALRCFDAVAEVFGTTFESFATFKPLESRGDVLTDFFFKKGIFSFSLEAAFDVSELPTRELFAAGFFDIRLLVAEGSAAAGCFFVVAFLVGIVIPVRLPLVVAAAAETEPGKKRTENVAVTAQY